MQNHDTDILMRNLWVCMCEDAKSATNGLIDLRYHKSLVISNQIARFRSSLWPGKFQAPVYVFKWVYQLENFWKRYRFKVDMFSDAELELKLHKGFNETQQRLACHQRTHGAIVRPVIAGARALIKGILGSYDLEEHIRLAEFGRNAAVGTPLSRSYFDDRLSKPLSGSADHISWFQTHCLSKDEVLRRALYECAEKPSYRLCDHLKLTGVPKSFKALRGIMPNTELGVYYTSGLGNVITARLKDAGLDIRKMQHKHQMYAKKFSTTRTHVTADLSAASDSFTCALVNELVPRPWFRLLNFGRIKRYSYGEEIYHMESFMTMGIGFTFPLQTLLFYALIKTIGALMGVTGVYSVYGDDLIYPRKIHRHVKLIFNSLGFILNEDKTFVESHFRESCGGDYYRGVDVRPFCFEGSTQLLGRQPYIMLLYKIANGLRRRWNEHDIPRTLYFIRKEILSHDGIILQIPPSYPDDSGWKTECIIEDKLYFEPVRFDKKTYGYQFPYYRLVANDRAVRCQSPYYWETLRTPPREPSLYSRCREILKWKWVTIPLERRRKFVRFRLRPYTTSKSRFQFTRQTGLTSCWI